MGENNPSLSAGIKGKSKAKLTEPPGSGGANLVGDVHIFVHKFVI